jgi:hypothetical protein
VLARRPVPRRRRKGSPSRSPVRPNSSPTSATWPNLADLAGVTDLHHLVEHARPVSDERPAGTPTNDQVIGHYTSTNGGVSWIGSLIQDVAYYAARFRSASRATS